jgi:hypothetical protein
MSSRNAEFRVPQEVIDACLNRRLNWQGPIFRGLRICRRYEAPPQLYTTRVVGREVWKAEVLLTNRGVAIGYTGPRTSQSGRKRVMLGFAMGYVKDDDLRIEY